MIVLDASVVVELLTNGPLAEHIRAESEDTGESFIAPHLVDIEVVSAIRRLTARRNFQADRGEEFLAKLPILPVERYPTRLSLAGFGNFDRTLARTMRHT
jgi:predicted nucleic acid-binding protein